MHDVAIVGGGLCGLALAHSLQARRVDWALLEARPRLGGRVLTSQTDGGPPLDLGPTWFWPATQPSIARLVADLGLPTLAQPDDGQVLLLDDPNRAPRARAFDARNGTLGADDTTPPAAASPGALHGGARRLAGGMAALTDALAMRLPGHRLHTGLVLQALVDRGSHVELHGLRDGVACRIDARRVVLALPPRLAAATLRFEPALPAALCDAMADTPTWMASAAKAAVACARAGWRGSAGAGNAWVTHPQAVLAEVWDAGPADAAAGAALAGFVALGAAQRPAFRRGLPMLVDSQLAMLFGEAAAPAAGAAVQLMDWADEPFTCTDADRHDDARPGAHPAYGDARLQQALWQGRLWLGGSETASQGGGYLEGALASAARLRLRLAAAANDPATGLPATAAAAAAGTPDPNPTLLAGVAETVRQQREGVLQVYRDQVHRALSQQQDDQLTQRALLGTLESLYGRTLAALAALPLQPAPARAPAEPGHHALTPLVLAPFQGLAEELMAEALRFNATSCALSNFPVEHRPGAEYQRTIRRDLAAAWQQFARQADDLLHARVGGRQATPA